MDERVEGQEVRVPYEAGESHGYPVVILGEGRGQLWLTLNKCRLILDHLAEIEQFVIDQTD